MQMQCNVYGVLKKFKMSKTLGVIWNRDLVLRLNPKFGKIYAFLRVHVYSKIFNTKHVTYLGNSKYHNNDLQTISFKNWFLWKICFLTKGPQNDNNC
jgi:hypothetical protein